MFSCGFYIQSDSDISYVLESVVGPRRIQEQGNLVWTRNQYSANLFIEPPISNSIAQFRVALGRTGMASANF